MPRPRNSESPPAPALGMGVRRVRLGHAGECTPRRYSEPGTPSSPGRVLHGATTDSLSMGHQASTLDDVTPYSSPAGRVVLVISTSTAWPNILLEAKRVPR